MPSEFEQYLSRLNDAREVDSKRGSGGEKRAWGSAARAGHAPKVDRQSARDGVQGEDGDRDADVAIEIRVADIVEHARRPGRYLLTLTDGRTFTLSVQLLADTGATRKGALLDLATVARIENEAAVLRVMDKAVDSLSRGRRTRRELEQRLRRVKPGVVGPDKETIALALDRLVEQGVLSDDAAARAEASSRLRRGDAPFRVRQILQRKGIERSAAAEAVAMAVTEDAIDEDAQCLALATKRMRSLAKLEAPIAKRRLVAFLVRRGYASNSIRMAVAEHFGAR